MPDLKPKNHEFHHIASLDNDHLLTVEFTYEKGLVIKTTWKGKVVLKEVITLASLRGYPITEEEKELLNSGKYHLSSFVRRKQ